MGPPSENDHDLLMHIEERIDGMNNLINERFNDFTQQMRRLAEQRDRDAAQSNEWRAAINDISTNKLDRTEFERSHSDLIHRVDAALNSVNLRLSQIETNLASATGSSAGRMTAVAIGAVVISLVGLVIVIVTHLGGA